MRRARRTGARWLGVLAPLLLLPAGSQAALGTPWGLQDTAKAPVLVVGRVLNVQRGERDADASRKRQTDIFDMTAEMEVLRSFTHGGETIAANRIRVGYLGITPNMFPYPLPILEPGQVLVLPLQENKNPGTVVWRMTVESGEGFIVPAAAVLRDDGPPPATARPFLLREIANSIGRGTPREAVRTARYLAMQDAMPADQGMAGELMAFLEPMIGSDRQGWANVLTGLLAGMGAPRPTVADLFSNNIHPPRESMVVARAALGKLGQSPDTDALLIRTWIGDAPWEAWGAATSLVEFAKNPVTTETLRAALRNDVLGSAQIAQFLVQNGNREILTEALARALRVADRPADRVSEVQAAGMLLRQFGSDHDLDRVAALVRQYQAVNRDFYMSLWQSAASPRVLAVVLSDRRIVPDSSIDGFRVCDYALSELERAVGQKFGAGDEGIARAQSWLKSQGITN
jgi:hypothetical protein